MVSRPKLRPRNFRRIHSLAASNSGDHSCIFQAGRVSILMTTQPSGQEGLSDEGTNARELMKHHGVQLCGPTEAPIQVRGRRPDQGQHRTGQARDGQVERCSPGMVPRRGPPDDTPRVLIRARPSCTRHGSPHRNATTRKGKAGNEDGKAEVHHRQEEGARGTPRRRGSQVRTGWRHR